MFNEFFIKLLRSNLACEVHYSYDHDFLVDQNPWPWKKIAFCFCRIIFEVYLNDGK